MFSPDGRWLAYSQRLPQVAVNWTPDGRRLVYFPGGGNAVAVDFRATPSVGFGRPTPLPGGGLPINVSPGSLLNHDVHPDGRFVTVADVEEPGVTVNRNAVVIVQNWTEELKPVGRVLSDVPAGSIIGA